MASHSPAPVPRQLLVGAVLCWAGVIVCHLLWQASVSGGSLLCPVGFDCRTVLSSRFSTLLGIPLPWVGGAFYFALFLAHLLVMAMPAGPRRKLLLQLVLGACVAALSFSAGLMYLQFAVLRAFCGLCTTSAVLLLALTCVVALAKRRYAEEEFGGVPRVAMGFLAFAIVSLAGFALPMLAGEGSVVAKVDGKKILRRQMDEELRDQVWPEKQKIHAAEMAWVQAATEATLLAEEARRRKTSVAELLATSDRRTLLAKLATERGLQSFLAIPRGPVSFRYDNAFVTGSREAQVELVVFSDFTCHFCIEQDLVLRHIRNEFPQIKIVHLDFPLTTDGPGFRAALAGRCAAAQGKFWKFHDRLFDEKGNLPDARLREIALEVGLDGARFDEDMRASATSDAVNASTAIAFGAGANGAPSLFLNGTMIGGFVNYVTLRRKIGEALTTRFNASIGLIPGARQ